jgi:NADH:ubiquinone oxidoreductase subunit 5 (subunit L)/multisubunit Na+/H+ antiporter MnhA subunit
MALALIVLAAGSVFAGLVGIPHALGGANRIEAFLDPAFEAHEVAPANPEFQVVPGRLREDASAGQGRPRDEAAGAGGLTPAEPGHEEGNTELMLMALSSGIAVAGIGLAWYFWKVNRAASARIARSVAGVYTLLLNKYYIDELYDAVIVRPIQKGSTVLLWRGADAGLIDGAVNGVGKAVRGTSDSVRRLQTGSVRAYAASLFLGVVVILGWYLTR